MKFGWLIGIVCGLALHLAVLLFGGLIFQGARHDAARPHEVELLSDLEAEEDEPKPEEELVEPDEQLVSESEEPPELGETLRDVVPQSSDDAPALEAASLSAIEAALNGASGGGDFADALSFSSGGRIGGTGTLGDGDTQRLDDAFSLAEIDQRPRAVTQSAPSYPLEMRGKKIEGVVTIIFVVDAAGRVSTPRVESASHEAFGAPALDAVKKWKFEPGVRAGERVACKMRVSIRFPAS